MRTISRALHALVTRRMDPRPLAVLRIAVGLLCLLGAWEYTDRVHRWLSAPGAPRVPYPGLEGLPASGPAIFALIFAAWIAAAILLTLGVWARASAVVLVLAMGWTMVVDQTLTGNSLYTLWVEALVLTVARSDGAYTIRHPRMPSVPWWPAVCLMALVPIIYGFTALAKLTPDWLSGWIAWRFIGSNSVLPFPSWWHTPSPTAVHRVFAAGVVATEGFLAVGLFFQRTRALAAAVGVALHLGIIPAMPWVRLDVMGFTQIGGAMLALYPLFFFGFSVGAQTGASSGRTRPVEP